MKFFCPCREEAKYNNNGNDNDDKTIDEDGVDTVTDDITWSARPLLLFLPIESSYKVVISIKKGKKNTT